MITIPRHFTDLVRSILHCAVDNQSLYMEQHLHVSIKNLLFTDPSLVKSSYNLQEYQDFYI